MNPSPKSVWVQTFDNELSRGDFFVVPHTSKAETFILTICGTRFSSLPTEFVAVQRPLANPWVSDPAPPGFFLLTLYE